MDPTTVNKLFWSDALNYVLANICFSRVLSLIGFRGMFASR